MRRMLLVFMALLLFAPLASAQVYRWVDAKGTVHFSQTPPPPGMKYEVMHMASNSASDAAASAPAPAGQTTPNAAGTAPAAKPSAPANAAELCKQLHQNLSMLNSQEALNVAGADGKPVALSDQQRAVQKATTEAQIKQYCSHQPNGQ